MKAILAASLVSLALVGSTAAGHANLGKRADGRLSTAAGILSQTAG